MKTKKLENVIWASPRKVNRKLNEGYAIVDKSEMPLGIVNKSEMILMKKVNTVIEVKPKEVKKVVKVKKTEEEIKVKKEEDIMEDLSKSKENNNA